MTMPRRLQGPLQEAPNFRLEALEAGGDSDTIRTTFKIDRAAKKKMDSRVKMDGYGPRGKSRWIIDAAFDLIDENSSWENSVVADYEESKGVVPHPWKAIIVDTEIYGGDHDLVKEGVTLPRDIRTQLWRYAVDAMQYAAYLDDPAYGELSMSVGSVLRAGVTWRLEKEPKRRRR